MLSSKELLHSLQTVERAIQQNLYHDHHRLYRAVPGADVVSGMEEFTGKHVEEEEEEEEEEDAVKEIEEEDVEENLADRLGGTRECLVPCYGCLE